MTFESYRHTCAVLNAGKTAIETYPICIQTQVYLNLCMYVLCMYLYTYIAISLSYKLRLIYLII